MRYTWDFKELRETRDNLVKVYNDSNYIGNKNEIESTLEMYNKMLKLANKKVNNYDQFDDTFDDELTISELIEDFLYTYSEKYIPILRIILPSINVIKDFGNSDLNAIRVKSSDSDIVDMTLNFFETMTTPTLHKYMKDLFKNNKHFLNIDYFKDYNYIPAITFADVINKKKYIAMSRDSDILDYITLPHELFHYYYDDFDSEIIYKHNSIFLREVEGMFSNILFADYFQEYLSADNTDVKFIKNYNLSCFKEQVTDLVVRNSITNSFDKNGKVRIHKLNKYMDYYNFGKIDELEELRDYLSKPQEENMIYALSYLTALDLYYIYKYDRELAFYLLKSIKYFVEEDDIRSLLIRCHITFFEDDYKNLKDYIGLNKRKLKKIGEFHHE